MSKDTLFTNDAGAAGGTTDYVKDVFADVSLPASNNSGLTSSASTNPLGGSFANDDAPKYSAKTLYIKDFVLIEDRSKWVSDKPTYKIIWHENFPGADGYLFGNFSLQAEPGDQWALGKTRQLIVTAKSIGDGIGVTGVIRRVAFLVNDNISATATAQVVVDGANGGTIDFSSLADASDRTKQARFSAFAHAAANETRDLHDIRLTSLQSNTLSLVGVVVYFENTPANIDTFPGVTYVDKSKISTTSGSSLALPSYGSSLGGRALVYKTQTSGYALSALSASTIQSTGTGSAASANITVTTGHGASFKVGYGVVAGSGLTAYVGGITAISTDTLTVFPALNFAVAGPIYRAWNSGLSAGINASLMMLANQIDFSQVVGGVTLPILDANGKYAMWGMNVGVTLVDSEIAAVLTPGTGALTVEGRFSAADFETIGNGILHATFSINGIPQWSINAGQTGIVKRNIFSDAGPGWHRLQMSVGTSQGTVGIQKINLYQRAYNQGITFGQLAEFETNQAYTTRAAINATFSALGLERRVFADQIYFKGISNWRRGYTTGVAGNHYYEGASGCIMQFQYYGQHVGILGVPGGGTLTIDGGGVGLTFGHMLTVASEGWHTVQYTVGTGASAQIHGIDFSRTSSEIKNLQKFTTSIPASKGVFAKGSSRSEVRVYSPNGFGSVGTTQRKYNVLDYSRGTAIQYTSDSVNGDSWTILEDGIYALDAADYRSTNVAGFGVIRNFADGTSNVNSIANVAANAQYVLVASTIPNFGTSTPGTVAWTGELRTGDVLRVHTTGTVDAGGPDSYFHIVKIRSLE